MNWGIAGFVVLASVANVFGGFIIFIKKDWSRRSLNALMALSAGVLVSIAFLDLIPEAIHEDANSAMFILLGFMSIFFFQQFVAAHFHFGEETHRHGHPKSAATGAFMGLMIHTFFDGLSIVASFSVDIRLGVTVLFAVLLHKIPDGLTISSIVFAIYQNKQKAIWAAIMLGVSTITGAVVAVLLSGMFMSHEQMITIAISFTAGIFLYVAGTDLLPVINRTEDRPVSSLFFVGVLLYFLLQWGFEILAPGMH